MACGLSLGEYTALAYAGAMSFEDGVKLVKLRGESMQAAADAKPSGMVSVIGLDADKVGGPRQRGAGRHGGWVGRGVAQARRVGIWPVSECGKSGCPML